MNPKVNFFFEKEGPWQAYYQLLRSIMLDTGMVEELKWGVPCYTYNKKNIVLIHGFKEYCAILFMKGALLHDEKGLLIQQTANVQSARQVRFTQIKDITSQKKYISQLIYQAIEVEKAGIKVTLKKTAEFDVPEEFKTQLAKNKSLKKAFESLTPGRQRAYLFHFSQAKQSKTREARIEKYIPKILMGLGLED